MVLRVCFAVCYYYYYYWWWCLCFLILLLLLLLVVVVVVVVGYCWDPGYDHSKQSRQSDRNNQ